MARRKKNTSNIHCETTKKNTGKIQHETTIIDGITFDSKMESKYYLYLKELKAQGIVTDFRLQPEFLLQESFIIVDGVVIYSSNPDFNKIKRKTKAPIVQAIKYISDFDVDYADGHNEVVDPKGVATADFKLKRKMFMCKYPERELKVLILYKKEWIDYDAHQKDIKAAKKAKKLLEGN